MGFIDCDPLLRSLHVKRDDVVSHKLFLKAAEQGHTKAILAVGDDYRNGLGVAQDRTASFRYYSQAAEQKYPPAICNRWGSGI
jgi:uncharacterized protein